MEAYTHTPLVPAHVPKDHPVVTREYSLFTPAISEMVDTVAGCLDDQIDGATIFGPSRFGKSSAVDHWLPSLLAERYGGQVPMVVWSHVDSGGAASVGRFYSHLLHASRHRNAAAVRSPLDREHMLVERWTQLASQDAGRFLVLVIDEAQGMTQREWLWLVELHSALEKQHLRLCVFSIASIQVFDEPLGMALSGGAHVAARFMLASAQFHGIQSLDELEFVLSGYDDATEWPPRSGLSFTAGLAPKAWAEGFRMAHLAPRLMQALEDELPARYRGPKEFPMKTVAHCGRHVLLRVAGHADPADVMSAQSLRRIVAGSGFQSLMAVVTALSPRLKPRGTY